MLSHGTLATPQRRAISALQALRPHTLLTSLILLYFVMLAGGMCIKWIYWGQGYDQVDYQQALWNTLHGRPFQTSHYNFSDSFLGLDFAPGLLFALPFFALWPSAYTLIILQSALLALGAIPVYLIARDHFAVATPAGPVGGERAGLAWAATYLLYPTLQFVNMSPPWQPRTLAVLCLLWAFRFFEQRRILPFLLMLLVAITTRTDTSLVVLGWGLLALIRRRDWRWWLPVMVLGFGWFYLSTQVVTPRFYHTDYQPAVGTPNFDPEAGQQSDAWPGPNPQIGYYAHLGKDPVDIAKNILTHPVETLNLMLTKQKLWYLFLMFGTLLFLPIFAPDVLLLCAPIFVINLLSTRIYQYTIREQYQTLIIPGIVLAGVVGAARLWRWIAGWLSRRQDESAPSSRAGRPIPVALLVAQVLLVGLLHIPLKNPVIVALRYHEDPARVAVMEQMAALIPADARVAATSFLAPHLLPRQHLYYVPPGPMHPKVDEAEYVFIDERAQVLKQHPDLMRYLRTDPRWQVAKQGTGPPIADLLPRLTGRYGRPGNRHTPALLVEPGARRGGSTGRFGGIFPGSRIPAARRVRHRLEMGPAAPVSAAPRRKLRDLRRRRHASDARASSAEWTGSAGLRRARASPVWPARRSTA
jgi:uncharacterized membrane protein